MHRVGAGEKMTIEFRAFALQDWLVYEGQNELKFPAFEEGRNIIVINGPNGFGKTSLLRAMEFVFHNESKLELIKSLNDVAREKKRLSLSARIDFQQGGEICQLIRKVEFRERQGGLTPTGEPVLISNGRQQEAVEDRLSQIFPEECQQFVFFDGAEISRYAQKQHLQGVRDAIERVLGIPAIRNLREDLSSLVDDLEGEEEHHVESHKGAQQLLQLKSELEAAIKSLEESRTRLNERLQGVTNSMDQLRKEAAQLETIKAERDTLAEKEKRLAQYRDQLKQTEDQIQSRLKYAPLLLLRGQLKELLVALEAQVGAGPTRVDKLTHRAELLEEILEKAKCLCGSEVAGKITTTLKSELQRVREALRQTEKPQGGSGARKDAVEVGRLVQFIDSMGTDAAAILDQRANLEVRIEELEQEIRKLEERLQGHDQVEVGEIFKQLEGLKEQKQKIEEDLRGVDVNLVKSREDLKDKKRLLDGMSLEDQKMQQVVQTLNDARRALEALHELVEVVTQEKRKQVEDFTTQTFNKITNKPHEYAGVRVKDDYTLEVFRKDSTAVPNEKLSAGEKEVLAYSFITALNLSSPSPAPFVMDTPFGHLDSVHREGLLKSLPTLPVQVILLATDRDLPDAERHVIEKHVAAEFWIKRDQSKARSFFSDKP